MNKTCKIILAVVLVLALIAIGYVCYNKVQEDKMGPVSFESFKKVEADGKVFMENKDIGLKFMVPEGWEVENAPWASISVKTPDFIPFTNPSPLPKSGCLININPEIQIEGSKYDLQYTYYKQIIDDKEALAGRNIGKEKCEIVELSGIKAVRDNTFIDSNVDNNGNYIYVAIPYNNIIYRFETYIFGQDKEKCLQNFDNLITTISIKKK